MDVTQIISPNVQNNSSKFDASEVIVKKEVNQFEENTDEDHHFQGLDTREISSDKSNLISCLDQIKTDKADILLEAIKEESTEIKVDNVPTNNSNFYCNECTEAYKGYCAKCVTVSHFLNNPVLPTHSKWKLKTIPKDILEITVNGVISLKTLPMNIIFGPFEGISSTESTNGYNWKIKDKKLVNIKNGNWMQCIKSDASTLCINLDVFQFESNLYFQTKREIKEGEELLVHYNEEDIQKSSNGIEDYYIPIMQENSQKVFACTFCCLGFNLEKCLIKHKIKCPHAVHDKDIIEIIQCGCCNVWLEKEEYLDHHMSYCWGNSSRIYNFPAPINQIKTTTMEILETDTNYENFNKLSPNRLDYHQKNCKKDLEDHSIKPSKVTQFECKFCKMKFGTQRSLSIHLKYKHLEEFKNSLKCLQCSYQAKREYHLLLHQHKHAEKENKKCPHCNYQTIKQNHLKRHITDIHNKDTLRKYKCIDCLYQTNDKTKMQFHIRNKHTDRGIDKLKYTEEIAKKFKCTQCSYQSNYKHHLSRHISNKHTEGIEKEFKCAHCPYEVNNKEHLKFHIKNNHTDGEKDYRCKQCLYQTNYRYSLIYHIRNRHSEGLPKRYKCPYCPHATNYRDKLIRHITCKHEEETMKENIKENLEAEDK